MILISALALLSEHDVTRSEVDVIPRPAHLTTATIQVMTRPS